MARQSRSFWTTPNGWGAIALIGAASYFLITEHREHVFEYFPYLILLLCPVMHLFMHHGHGHHHNDVHHREYGQRDESSSDRGKDGHMEESWRLTKHKSEDEYENHERRK
ncbi:DUF2933 domain-containing protein [Vibrio natriegens]|uniref:DUF2933 domain-containing protein n=1 Tax=Vibrio natriegens TaxID=691 RepID=UPI00399089F3